jgi:hypothetical protein
MTVYGCDPIAFEGLQVSVIGSMNRFTLPELAISTNG